jgi:putative endonuclease
MAGILKAMSVTSYHVYVLKSLRDGKTYTGVAGDLKRRMAEHARGHVRSTRNRRPLVLVYVERLDSKQQALERERFFKTPAGGMMKQRLLAERSVWLPLAETGS